jgi:hypothetical protein
MKNDPITPEEISQIIRDLAVAQAAVNDGHVNVFELKHNVECALGDRVTQKKLLELEDEIQFTAARAMSIHMFGHGF